MGGSSVVSLLGICTLFAVSFQIFMVVNRMVDEDINVPLGTVADSNVRNDVLLTYTAGGFGVALTPQSAPALTEIANSCKLMTGNRREFIAFILIGDFVGLGISTDGDNSIPNLPAIRNFINPRRENFLVVCALDRGSHDITDPVAQCAFAVINPGGPSGLPPNITSILQIGINAELGLDPAPPTTGTTPTATTASQALPNMIENSPGSETVGDENENKKD